MQALASHPSTVPDPQAMTKPRPTVLDYHYSYLAGVQMLLWGSHQGGGGGEGWARTPGVQEGERCPLLTLLVPGG